MKESPRARRIKRHYSRMHRTGGLNLVSLMDIFTILVFFLMVNSSEVKVLQQTPSIKLPESKAEVKPAEQLTITLTKQDILVQGRPVARIADIKPDSERVVPLYQELTRLADRKRSPEPQAGWPVTIVGDRSLPYRQLRTVMKTSVDAGFRRVSLAVNRKQEQEAAGG